MSFSKRIRATIAAQANRPFYIDVRQQRVLTYRELDELARMMAAKLRAAGVIRGQRLGIVLHNSPVFAALYFACLLEGWVAVPVSPALHPRDIDYALRASGVAALVYQEKTVQLVPPDVLSRQDLPKLRVLESGLEIALESCSGVQPASDTGEEAQPGDLFAITFTSGTTSRPKGVCHTVGSLLGAAEAFNAANGIGAEHRFYHVLSMSYMAGFLNTLLCPFLAGGAVAVDEPFGPSSALRFWDAPLRWQLNILWLVPTICASLLRLDRSPAGKSYARDHVQRAFVGTAPLAGRLREQFEQQYGVRLLESYGLSEILFVAANTPDTAPLPGSVGPTLPGVALRIIDETGSELPAGQEGEILVRTPFAMAGYLDTQKQEPERLAHNAWFPTGDIGRVGPDGMLLITGRKKDLIIRGGVNVSPRSIEEVLLEHPAVEEAAVIGIPHEFYGEDTLAVVKLKSDFELCQVREELVSLCRGRLNSTAQPGRFVQVAEFPRSSTGKLSKVELRAQLSGLARGERAA